MTNSPSARMERPVVVAGAATAGEAMLTWLFFSGKMNLIGLFVGHLAIMCLLVAMLLWFHIRRYDIKHIALLAMLTFFIGIYGASICFACSLLYLFYSRYATPFKEWYTSLFPENKSTASSVLYERLMSGKDDFSEKDEVLPFVDVLALGSEQQKRHALDKITRHFSPEFAPALLKATNDPSNAIRVQAASILAKLENNFSTAMYRLQKKSQSNPGNPKLLYQLAKHYDAYANAGFLTDTQHQKYLEQSAIETYAAYLKHCPDNQKARVRLARVYMRTGQNAEAYALLQHCLGLRDCHPKTIWYAMECLFCLQRWAELKQMARKYFPLLNPDDAESFELLEMVKLWGGGIASSKEAVVYDTHS